MNFSKSSSVIKKSLEDSQLEIFYRNKNSLLQQISSQFSSNNSFVVKIGVELELYLLNYDGSKIPDPKIIENFITDLIKEVPQNSLIYKIEKEQGCGQIEIKTKFTADLLKTCEEIEAIKISAKNLAIKRKLIASFMAQNFFDDCGSALQFNISLHDERDQNLFLSNSEILQKTTQQLLQMTNSMMIFLAPNQEDYDRFCLKTNLDLFRKGKFTAPINLSFGVNNRTCAIRIPDKSQRLEYRVAAANADIALCLSTILLAISSVPKITKSSSRQIYGNAFDEKYQLESFCKNLPEAKKVFFHPENFIYQKLNKFCEFYQLS